MRAVETGYAESCCKAGSQWCLHRIEIAETSILGIKPNPMFVCRPLTKVYGTVVFVVIVLASRLFDQTIRPSRAFRVCRQKSTPTPHNPGHRGNKINRQVLRQRTRVNMLANTPPDGGIYQYFVCRSCLCARIAGGTRKHSDTTHKLTDNLGLSSHLLGLSSLSLFFSELTLLAFFFFSAPHYGCPSTFFRPAHAGESWECPCLVAGTDVCLALPMALSSVLSEASYFGPWSGSAAWMQGSDSALPRATPSTYGTLCVSVLSKRRFGPRGTGVGASPLLREEDLQGYTRSRPMNGPLLAARCAGDKKSMDCQTTYRSNGKDKEQAAFKRSSIMQRSPTLTTGTPTRGLKTSPPPVPFKAVSDTGSPSGSGKKKEEVDLAMEVTNPETPQAKKEGIPPSKSPLRAAFGLQMLQQQHDDASEEEDLSLKKMKALLKEMAKALLTQMNVNKAIKDGIPKLDDFLGEIEE
ncbi:hypothetical protein J6590_001584 [Homalodisca vitripennis]|nr:hypothetical protein J6590_001584 [Homalodisca vitripennis]